MRFAVPKGKMAIRVDDCCGLATFIKLDPKQRWIITDTNIDKRFLKRRGQILVLTFPAFDRLFTIE